MDRIRVEGGRALCGSVYIQGSKNAALPVMAAAVLHRGITVLKNCPCITDVSDMERILESLGARTMRRGMFLSGLQRYPWFLRSSGIRPAYAFFRDSDGKPSGTPGKSHGSLSGRLYHRTAAGGSSSENFQEDGDLCGGEEGNAPRQLSGNTADRASVSLLQRGAPRENAILAAAACKGRDGFEKLRGGTEVKNLCLFLKKMGGQDPGYGDGLPGDRRGKSAQRYRIYYSVGSHRCRYVSVCRRHHQRAGDAAPCAGGRIDFDFAGLRENGWTILPEQW